MIGINTNVDRSTIGDNCIIGKNVTIKNSYIWHDVIIEDNCVIEDSIICDGVKIRQGVHVNAGSMISFKVIVKEGVQLPKGTIASMYTYDSNEYKFVKADTVNKEYFE